MEIGWCHEFQGQVEDQSDADAFAMGVDQVCQAEEWGLDAVWLAEIHQQADRSVMSAPLSVLATVAGRTTRLKLGTGVQVLPLTHPLRLAEETATVDQISRGRLLMGVGRSGNPRAYAAYGVPYSESRDRFFEAKELLKLAWTQTSFSFRGKYYNFDKARAVPRRSNCRIRRFVSPERPRIRFRCSARLVTLYSSLCAAGHCRRLPAIYMRIEKPTQRRGTLGGVRCICA